MTTQHTPEPWTIEDGDSIYGGQDSSIEIYVPFSDVLEEENLLRIVACVNACAGIPTEELQNERDGTVYTKRIAIALADYGNLIKEAAEIKQQRDELLAVANRLAEWCDKYPSSRIYSESSIRKIAAEIDAIGADAKAAIATAGGQQS